MLAIIIICHCCCLVVNVSPTIRIVRGHSPLLLQLHMENWCNMHWLLTNDTLVREESVPEERVGGFYEVGLGDHIIVLFVGAEGEGVSHVGLLTRERHIRMPFTGIC